MRSERVPKKPDTSGIWYFRWLRVNILHLSHSLLVSLRSVVLLSLCVTRISTLSLCIFWRYETCGLESCALLHYILFSFCVFPDIPSLHHGHRCQRNRISKWIHSHSVWCQLRKISVFGAIDSIPHWSTAQSTVASEVNRNCRAKAHVDTKVSRDHGWCGHAIVRRYLSNFNRSLPTVAHPMS